MTVDWTAIAADFASAIAENPQSLILRRGKATLAAQTARIARAHRVAQIAVSDHGAERRGRVVLVGACDFDVQPGDRFNDANGALYRVVLVRPNRRAAVIAEAELVE